MDPAKSPEVIRCYVLLLQLLVQVSPVLVGRADGHNFAVHILQAKYILAARTSQLSHRECRMAIQSLND